MPNRWLRRFAIPVGALAAAEIGHLLTYAVRFGPGALAIQTDGGHRYLPSLLALTAGWSGTLVMAALLLTTLARTVGTRVTVRSSPLVNLASGLLILQLAIFGLQEAGEALAMHAALPDAADLAFWGILGQLGPALVTALILRRLLAEVEGAIEVLSGIAPVRFAVWPAVRLRVAVDGSQCSFSALYQAHSDQLRGPPLSA